MNPTSFTIWDTETTGLDKALDVPVEIGALVTDSSLQPIRDFHLSCRPPRFVLPQPGALLTTKRRISELMSRSMTAYETTSRFKEMVEEVTPTCFVTYNGVKFDDPLIQHTFYRHLHDPYVMMRAGNSRLDMLRLVQLAYALGRGDLVVPMSEVGKVTFKLDQIAPLNGFEEKGAHSALVDARAVLHLARRLATRAPELWARAVRLWSRKDAVLNLVGRADVIVQFSWDWRKGGRPSFKALHPIGPGRSYPGDIVCLDLAIDPAEYMSLAPGELTGKITIGPKPRPICAVRLNGFPIVFNGDDPLVHGRVPVDAEVLAQRAQLIRRNSALRDRVLEAVDLSRDSFEEPEHPEQQLYSGGFFSDPDMIAMEQFHLVAPEKKLEVVRTFADTRLQYLGERLIFEEWPTALPVEIRARLDAELRAVTCRLWSALGRRWQLRLEAIEDLLPNADDKGRAILIEYQEYLKGLLQSQNVLAA